MLQKKSKIFLMPKIMINYTFHFQIIFKKWKILKEF